MINSASFFSHTELLPGINTIDIHNGLHINNSKSVENDGNMCDIWYYFYSIYLEKMIEEL